MIWNIIFSCNLALASNADHDYYVQYSGSTDASWGYHPNCTFTVEKIVDNRFIGEFAALNLGTYKGMALPETVNFGSRWGIIENVE